VKQNRNLLDRNIRLFYVITALEYAFFNDAVLILFGREYLHLNYFQAGSLFFIGWFVSIFLDFWGGVIADKIGRKESTLWGIGLQFISYLPYLLSKSYPLLVVGSIVWGIGVALSSNALHALIYEQVSSQNDSVNNAYAHISATSQVWLFVSVGLATIIGGFAYRIDPRLPYGLITITLLIAILLTALIYVPVKVTPKKTNITDKTSIVRSALRTFQRNKKLRNFILIGFLAGVFGDLLFAYYQPLYINLKVTAVTLGLLFGALRASSALGSLLYRRLTTTFKPSIIQLINLCGMLITTSLLLILKLPVILVAPLLLGITSGFVDPNMRMYVNKHAVDRVRTSVLSFSTTTMSLGAGIGFVTAYYLADIVSAHTVLSFILLGVVMTILLSIYFSFHNREVINSQ
jgi:MFS family permease